MCLKLIKKNLFLVITLCVCLGTEINHSYSMEETLSEQEANTVMNDMDDIKNELKMHPGDKMVAEIQLKRLKNIQKTYSHSDIFNLIREDYKELEDSIILIINEPNSYSSDVEQNKIFQELVNLNLLMRRGYMPQEKGINSHHARTNIVKRSIRKTLTLLGRMPFPKGENPEDIKKRDIMLTAFTDCIRFVKGGSQGQTKRYSYLDFIQYFDTKDTKHIADLLVYGELIEVALHGFRKTTYEDFYALLTKDFRVSTELKKKIQQEIEELDYETIDRLTETLPQNLKEMINLENIKITNSDLPNVNWYGYHGEYKYQDQAKLMKQWRKEADDKGKKIYLMVGRTNNELPAILSEKIMWIYVSVDAALMNPKGERFLLWDMNELNDPLYMPDAIFDGIVMDWSTWKFLGGSNLIPINKNSDTAKKFMKNLAEKQENSIKGWARILKDNGFVAFEALDKNSITKIKLWNDSTGKVEAEIQYPQEEIKQPEDILNDWFLFLDTISNNLKSNTSFSSDLPEQYTLSLFQKYFKAGYDIYEEFSFQTYDGDIILPFTPTWMDMKSSLEDKNNVQSKQKRFFARYPKRTIG